MSHMVGILSKAMDRLVLSFFGRPAHHLFPGHLALTVTALSGSLLA